MKEEGNINRLSREAEINQGIEDSTLDRILANNMKAMSLEVEIYYNIERWLLGNCYLLRFLFTTIVCIVFRNLPFS